MPAQQLPDLADALLTAVVSAAGEHAIDLPNRRYVSPGLVAIDCEQVAVQTPRVFRGLPNEQYASIDRAGDTFAAEFTVWLVRCTPVPGNNGQAPSAEALTANAEEILRDGWLLTKGMLPNLRTVADACSSLSIGQAVGYGPEAGYAGWSLGLIVGL